MAINLPNYERQTTILQKVEAIETALPTLGKKPKRQVFTSSGTWTVPASVTEVFVTGGGAGGGGGSVSTAAQPLNGSSGGITSFGTLLSLAGGGGGYASTTASSVQGSAPGGPGGEGSLPPNTAVLAGDFTDGGRSGFYFGGRAARMRTASDPSPLSKNGGYCSGGGAVVYTGNNHFASGGGGGDFVHNYPINVTPGVSHTITIGVGGQGGKSSTAANTDAGNGGNGILIIEWWE